MQLQVTVPSMASVYNEYALKSQYDTSIYLQVIFLILCYLVIYALFLGLVSTCHEFPVVYGV